MRGVGGGVIPDLRHMSAATHADWEAIVLDGARSDLGMISFAGQISPAEAEAIHAWLIVRANEDYERR